MPMLATPINRGPSEASAPAAAAPSRKTAGGAIDPIKPIAVRTIKVKLNGVQTASLTPPLAHLPVVAVKDNITTKASSPVEPPAEPASAKPVVQTASVKPAAALITAAPAAPSSPEPSHPAAAAPALIQVASAGPTIPVAAPAPAPIQVASAAPTISAAAAAPAEAAAPSAPRKVHTGWIIQVGAFEAEREAKDRLSSAQSKAKHLLARADAFTETVVNDNRTFFRARFAGFEKDEAEAACKYLKRNDFACMTLKN
jgi:D-alanyl-D-alanine carboxypeptidase